MRTALRRVDFRDCFEKQDLLQRLRDTTPPQVAPCTTVASVWKAAFIAAEADKKRTKIERRDLCRQLWTLWMRGRGHMYAHRRTFLPDSTYDSAFHTGKLDWMILAGNRVQIGPYPPLTPTRRADDWGWNLSNEYVTLRGEMDSDPPDM